MTVVESLPYALFCMSIVFSVLIILYFIIRIFSLLIGLFTKNNHEKPDVTHVSESVSALKNEPELSCGELKLHNVDEPTAALIMAIVSDESGIPLNELCFKSIKAKN